jgi:hypothetical protein
MKSYFKILVPVALGCTMAASCSKDFLKETSQSNYTPATITDSLGFQASLVGLYNNFSNLLTYSSSQGWPSVWQVGTDVANATANQQGIEIPYYDYSKLTSTDGAASVMWSKQYVLINLANTVIASVESPNVTSITQDTKNKISAEAKFFRGYAYNTLATLYGRVPLITTPLTAPKTDFVRASLDSVNTLIESDLLFSEQYLPDVNNVGAAPTSRANKYMPMQLLAEAYLRMGKNAEAEQQAQMIINSGKFSLISSRFGSHAGQPGDYYNDMFWYGSQRRVQGNSETIWTLEQENPTIIAGGNTDNAQQRRVWGAAYYNISGMKITDSLGGRGIARLRLSNWVLYSLYQDGDVRNSEWNIRRHYWYNDPSKPDLYGKEVPYTGPDTLYKICPHTTKWYQYDPKDEFGYAMIKDFILMRLGETYLLLAEAQVKQGKLQDAANSINVLRQRAFGANYPAQGQVQAADMTMDFILDERARELIGEENRRMTLMRTGTLVDRSQKLNSGDAQHPITGLTTNNLLLPIPLTEIQLNKDAVLEQNPGY